MNKKVLILGASILQLPAIKCAKKMGMSVAVADYNPNAIGIPYADKYYNCSTIDFDGVERVARDFGADGIMTTATDMPMRAIAYACEKLGLAGPSQECAFNCTDKIAMIKCFKSNGTPSPGYFEISQIEDIKERINSIGFPCIIKPSDNSGSRGVCLINSFEELNGSWDYIKQSSRCGKLIVEEYMQGPEVSVETFVVEGKANVLQITDKVTTGAPHFVEMGHSQPSCLSDKIKEQIVAVAQKACEAVGLKDGPAHLEMIITAEGPKMVEMGARMGGDCITSHLVPLSTGIDMIEQTIRYSVGLPVDLSNTLSKASAVIFLKAELGKITEISGIEEAKAVKGVRDVGFFKEKGDIVTDVCSSGDRMGYVVAQADDVATAKDICLKAMQKLKIIVK